MEQFDPTYRADPAFPTPAESEKTGHGAETSKTEMVGLPAIQPSDVNQRESIDSVAMPLNENVTGDVPAIRLKKIPIEPAAPSLDSPSRKIKPDNIAFQLMELRRSLDECNFAHVDVLMSQLDFSAADTNGNTAFHVICENGSPEIVKKALSLASAQQRLAPGVPNPSLRQPNKQGQLALHMVLRNPDMRQIAKILVEAGAPINESDNHKRTALSVACIRGDLQAVACLLQLGATLDCEGGRPSPLHLACQNNHCDIVECLLDKGVPVDNSWEGFTALELACQSGAADVVDLLIKKGADSALNERGQGLLQLACQKDNPVTLHLLLDTGLDINARDSTGRTALAVAIERGNLDQIRVLLDRGADRSSGLKLVATAKSDIATTFFEGVSDTEKNKMLWDASEDGDSEVAQLLLRNGASVGAARTSDGNTLLHMANQNGDLQMALLLLGHGAEVNATNAMGETPMSLCLKHNSPFQAALVLLLRMGGATSADLSSEVAEQLIWKAIPMEHAGVIQEVLPWIKNVDCIDSTGSPLTHQLYSFGFIGLVGQLIDRSANIDGTDANKNTLLLLALQRGDEVFALYLVDKGANTALGNTKGQTPLSEAIHFGMVKTVRKLVQKGAAMPPTDQLSLLLTHAAAVGDSDSLSWLLENGADLNAADPEGNTALQSACRTGNFSLARQLIEKGASLSYNSSDSLSPLNAAIIQGNAEFFEWLLEKRDSGLDLNRPNKQGDTPFSVACYHGRFDMARKLADRGVDISAPCQSLPPPLISAVNLDNPEFVTWLLEQHVDINGADKNGNTALGFACQLGHLDIARRLVQKGAKITGENQAVPPLVAAASKADESFILWLLQHDVDLNCKDLMGNTPLSEACHEGKWEVAKQLIQKGANVNAYGHNGSPPVVSAVLAGNVELVELLIDAHADINIQVAPYQQTPLHYACVSDNFEAVVMLTEHRAQRDICNTFGQTPFLVAMARASSDTIQWLLDMQTEKYHCDDRGNTPYTWLTIRDGLSLEESTVAEIKAQDLGRTQEILSRKMLAHRFGVDAVSIVDNHPFQLSGLLVEHSKAYLQLATQSYYQSLLCDASGKWGQVLSKLSPDTLAEVNALKANLIQDVLLNTYRAIRDSLAVDKKKLWYRIEAGDPVAIMTQWPGHAVALAFQGTRCARANKGDLSGDKPGIRVHTIADKKNLRVALEKSMGSTSSDYFLNGIETDLALQDEYYIQQKPQKVGNCAVANANGMETALLFLQLEPLLGSAKAEELANAIKKNRVEESRVGSLKEYLESHDKQSIAWQADLRLLAAIYSKKTQDPGEEKLCKGLIENWLRGQGLLLTDLLASLQP